MDEVTRCNVTAAKIPPEEQTHKPPDMGLSVQPPGTANTGFTKGQAGVNLANESPAERG